MEILSEIKRHSHKAPVTSRDLERKFQISGAQIRQTVNDLRTKGYPIGSDKRGYYYCHSRSELQPTLNHLKHRAKSLGMVYRSLGRVFPKTMPLFLEVAND